MDNTVDKNDGQGKGYPKSNHNFEADFIKLLFILIALKRSKIRGNVSSGPSLFMRYMADRHKKSCILAPPFYVGYFMKIPMS